MTNKKRYPTTSIIINFENQGYAEIPTYLNTFRFISTSNASFIENHNISFKVVDSVMIVISKNCLKIILGIDNHSSRTQPLNNKIYDN